MGSQISPEKVLYFVWLVWIISWVLAARWSDRASKGAGSKRQVPYQVITLIGAILLFGFSRQRYHHANIWRVGEDTRWGLVGLAAVGFAFTWWARLHLGRLWSRWVGRKADHRIIQTGPYALVRHPIYTGLDLAILVTAILLGTALAYLGAALMILSFYLKARLEERFLREELGAEAYDAYANRVPMVVPFLKI